MDNSQKQHITNNLYQKILVAELESQASDIRFSHEEVINTLRTILQSSNALSVGHAEAETPPIPS